MTKELLEIYKEKIFLNLSKNRGLVKKFTLEGLREIIDKNIRNIIIKDKKEGILGRYNIESNEIFLYFGKDFDESMIEDQRYLPTIIHESVHAIEKKTNATLFNLNSEEIKGTGLYEFDKNGEVGRAINEGYTNWIVKGCGIEVDGSYKYFTFINEQLEFLIGNEKMFELPDIGLKRLDEVLNMYRILTETFIRKLDEIDFEDSNRIDLFYMIKEISNNNFDFSNNCNTVIFSRIENKYPQIRQMIENIIQKKCTPEEKEKVIKILENENNILIGIMEKLVRDTEEILLHNLFKNKFQSLNSIEEFLRFKEILDKAKEYVNESDLNEFKEINEKINSLIEREVNRIINRLNTIMKNQNIDIKEINLVLKDMKKFKDFFSEDSINILSSILNNKSKLKTLNIKRTNNENLLFFINKSLKFMYDRKSKITYFDKLEIPLKDFEYKDLVEFIKKDLNLDEHFEISQEVIDKFNEIKLEKLKQNSNAKIKLIGDIIIFENEIYELKKEKLNGIKEFELRELKIEEEKNFSFHNNNLINKVRRIINKIKEKVLKRNMKLLSSSNTSPSNVENEFLDLKHQVGFEEISYNNKKTKSVDFHELK